MGRAEVPVRGVSQSGKFITLEGGEGVGKSTQAVLLAERLRSAGKTVVVTREPGGTPGAEAIRALLMTGDADRWSARAEALLFVAARADHVERVIRPALDRGEWVICDRFVDSTRAYQGAAGGLDSDDLLMLHMIATDGLMPDRTLLMRLAFHEAETRTLARDGETRDRFADKGDAYHAKLSKAFDAMARAEPDRFRTIDAEGVPSIVTTRLLAAIDDLL